MSDSAEDPATESCESLFASWLERVEPGAEADLEPLCREHPRHAAELRTLHGKWLRLQRALESSSLHGSLGSTPARPFGSGVDPRVTLEEEGPTPAGFSSEVLTRLSGVGPTTTRYSVKGQVAHGGMGAVLRVWDRDLRRHLAMKVMLGRGVSGPTRDTPSADPRFLARFLEEAQITGQLDHPGIVPVHELGLDAEGRVYFTMKLVQGRTLREVFDELARGEGGWTQARVLGLLQKVCEAMSYAHAKGVIHRDLKPANVMVGRFGEVFVMDWGLAKVLGREDDRDIRPRAAGGEGEAALTSDRLTSTEDTPGSPLLTMEGDVVGTPAYMPPEQARGDLAAMGPHSDVYAVGAMLYHLLAGHMPYVPSGERPSSRAVWKRVQEGPPQSLSEIAPEAPPELVALCEQAMAREVDRRYPDMSALSADLQAYLEGRVVAAYERGAWAEARKWVRRNKPLAVALAAALLAVVVGGIAFAVKATEATRRADDVFQLSALQDAQELLDRAGSEALWPAHPDRIPALDAWIGEARIVVAGLPEFEAKRKELRALALPWAKEEREQERSTLPEFPRLERRKAEIVTLRTALEQRRSGQVEDPPNMQLPEQTPTDPGTLNQQAWWRVKPRRRTFGLEAEGLALVRRGLERVGDDSSVRAMLEDTLAWAWYALGQDEKALAASRRALEAAPAAEKKRQLRDLARIEAATAWAGSSEGRQVVEDYLELLEWEVAELEARVDEQLEERRRWRFSASRSGERWWHEQLTELVEKLELLRSLLAEDALVPDYGWSVPKRLDFARELEASFGEGGGDSRQWAEAREELRATYPGLDLEPQMGLVPLGPDPDSGLWEFAHLMTGTPPERGPDGQLALEEETGVVLVLLPGGTFWMGAQKDDPEGRNYDPFLQQPWVEGPVHQVRLSPFFVSKYEMTQGQWLRLTGSNPAFLQGREKGPPLLFPVEFISWNRSYRWLTRTGLTLPSDAQWEHAARGGTSTPWFTGEEPASVTEARVANLWDEDAVARGVGVFERQGFLPAPPDGFAYTAPVGRFAPNPFGLHDVLGNVAEYCLDCFDQTFYRRSPWLDPVRPWEDHTIRVLRGGSCAAISPPIMTARSAYRRDCGLEGMNSVRGVRPARGLDH